MRCVRPCVCREPGRAEHSGGRPAQAQYVGDALQQNRSLRHVSLANCGITPAAAFVAAGALHDNVVLRHLDLSHNPIGAMGIRAVIRALRHSGVGQEVVVTSVDMTPSSANPVRRTRAASATRHPRAPPLPASVPSSRRGRSGPSGGLTARSTAARAGSRGGAAADPARFAAFDPRFATGTFLCDLAIPLHRAVAAELLRAVANQQGAWRCGAAR